MIHDGTHGVGVNSAIKMNDQVRSPNAGDVSTAMGVRQHLHFGLTGDVNRSHRLVKVAEDDWGLQACRGLDCILLQIFFFMYCLDSP